MSDQLTKKEEPNSDLPTFPATPSRIPQILSFAAAGVLCGALGTLLVFLFFPQLRQTYIPAGSQTIIVQQPGKVVVEEGSKLGEAAAKAQPMVAEIYHPAGVVKSAGGPIYLSKNRAGLGVLLTSDGWLGTIKAANVQKGDTIFISGEDYTIEAVVADKNSPFVLAKISGRTFPVVALGDVQANSTGQTLVAVGASGQAFRTSLWNKFEAATGASVSSDTLEEGFRVYPAAELEPGTPYFNLGGELLGLQSSTTGKDIVPTYALRSLLTNYLATKETRRPSLGIRYTSQIDATRDRNVAVIYSDSSAPAIAPKGPAASAKLRSGDIIISFNGQDLDLESRSIFSRLSDFKIGDNIDIGYLREGKVETVGITLGSN
jgi:S1-C subfamily serine protease